MIELDKLRDELNEIEYIKPDFNSIESLKRFLECNQVLRVIIKKALVFLSYQERLMESNHER